jgi:hypothetical protein
MTFSVNGSGVQARGSLKLTSSNISVTPGQGVPPVNLSLTDAAGNVYIPLPHTYIRITIIPSFSSRRHLLQSVAESSATCEAGGPKYVSVTNAAVTIDGSSVFACTAGMSSVQYDVGLIANGSVINNILVGGSFEVVTPAVCSFTILVSRGIAFSFGFTHRNSTDVTAFTTFTEIKNAFAVLCRDSGRNVRIMHNTSNNHLHDLLTRTVQIVSCNFTFTVFAAPTVIEVSDIPTKDITRTSPCFAFIENLPSKSACAERLVPLTTTLAPGSGPDLSETTPVTVFSCANENCIDNASNSVKIHLNFDLILILFELVILQTS